MSESENHQEAIQDEAPVTRPKKPAVELPGRRLREKRESSQLTREEVGHHLRLDAQLIKALEEDNFSSLPSPAYICGYLRSYARLLKLPEDEIVQAYNQGEQINSELVPNNLNIQTKRQIDLGGAIKKLVTVIVVVLVAGALYWLADKFELFNKFGAGSSETATHSRQLVVPPAPEETSQAQATDKTPDGSAPVKADAKKPAQQTAGDTRPASAEPPKPGKTLVEELPTSKSSIPGSEPASSEKPATQPSPGTGSTAQAAQTGPVTQLRMHFNDDSWAEVTDSTGNRLVYHLIEKNTDLDLDGVPPFTVLLGNAAAVQVFYQGKEFEHTQYRQDQVATFQVGVK